MHKSRSAYLSALTSLFNDQTEFTRPELRAAAIRCGLKWTPNWTCDPSRRISRGLFRVTEHLPTSPGPAEVKAEVVEVKADEKASLVASE